MHVVIVLAGFLVSAPVTAERPAIVSCSPTGGAVAGAGASTGPSGSPRSFTAIVMNPRGPLRAPTLEAAGGDPTCRSVATARTPRCYRITFRETFSTCDSLDRILASLVAEIGKRGPTASYTVENETCPVEATREVPAPGVPLLVGDRVVATTDGEGKAMVCLADVARAAKNGSPRAQARGDGASLLDVPWFAEQLEWFEAWELSGRLQKAVIAGDDSAPRLAGELATLASGRGTPPPDLARWWNGIFVDCLQRAEEPVARSNLRAATGPVELCIALDKVGNGAMRGGASARFDRLLADHRRLLAEAPLALDGTRCALLHAWLAGRDTSAIVTGIAKEELRSAKDEFERRRILERTRPVVAAQLAEVKAARRFELVLPARAGFAALGIYDFDRGGYPLEIRRSGVAFVASGEEREVPRGLADVYFHGGLPGTGPCALGWPPMQSPALLSISESAAERLLEKVVAENASDRRGADPRLVGVRLELLPTGHEEPGGANRVTFRIQRMTVRIGDEDVGDVAFVPFVEPPQRAAPAPARTPRSPPSPPGEKPNFQKILGY